eukprot:SAG22_NODE_486_length_9885_cov_2.043634_9_plen_426_part_00
MQKSKSEKKFEAAKQVLVGGVNSPVRSFNAVSGTPPFIKAAKGAYLYTEDDQKLIDYVLSWGPCILGHAHPQVIKKVQEAASLGLSYGAPCERETELAKLIQFFMPHLEKIRFVSSGTEAAMSALRLARGLSKKKYIIKFKGCYHGHADAFLVAAGSGNLTLSKPDSAGILEDTSKYTLICDYNNSEQIEAIFKEKGHDIAGIFIEPITGNMGVIKPNQKFLDSLEKCRKTYKSLIIFDEVMCGFRCHINGASAYLNFKPDITILGKVIGGGMPCGAFGASKEIMSQIAPEGPVYQAGTLSGNPISMTAGIETLKILKEDNAFKESEENCRMLCESIQNIIKTKNLNYQVVRAGNMFSLFFNTKPIQNLDDVTQSNIKQFPSFFHKLLNNKIYWPPSAYEACFMSNQHSKIDIEKTIIALEKVLK